MVVPAAVLAVAAVGGSCGHSVADLRIQEDGTHLEVEHSVAIKRKKPWPQLNWLGEVGVSPIGYR